MTSQAPQLPRPVKRTRAAFQVAGGTRFPAATAKSPKAKAVEGHNRNRSSKLDSLGLIDQQNVISRWHRKLPFGYPVPTISRDSILRRVLRALETQQIYSRGRFGAWLYEISNQDHSFMQGVELVNRLRGVGDETTLQSALRERDLQLNS